MQGRHAQVADALLGVGLPTGRLQPPSVTQSGGGEALQFCQLPPCRRCRCLSLHCSVLTRSYISKCRYEGLAMSRMSNPNLKSYFFRDPRDCAQSCLQRRAGAPRNASAVRWRRSCSGTGGLGEYGCWGAPHGGRGSPRPAAPQGRRRQSAPPPPRPTPPALHPLPAASCVSSESVSQTVGA